ncbi:Rieske 2Fe-2S domain-containing protein [Gluconacetobacter tumulisoli]|uniref:Rieske (2Fe-2S) protein n=1 Tax=Gluconacetobacter tumulisoli TaxID=1286189 RepID=A0A7W4KA00_9PROT|nr:Rieske 2Fe-2S domain-containing protein [Gluconacetobacter tumulisoli]MBB2203091.1 Rieske (2Fe-2S) protein [Gluconacetobacter tumulisoli]
MADVAGAEGDGVRLCGIAAVRERPVRVVIGGQALVVWMTSDGGPRVFADRCPHRDARLSAGYVADGRLVCPFHLWAFDEAGRAVGPDGATHPTCIVRRFDARLRDGGVWIDAVTERE